MSYQPFDRNPSGIVFFGTTAADQVFESNSNFTYDGSVLNVPNITLANGGSIGSVGDPDAMSIDANGDVTFSQDISIAGNLVVNGTTTTVNSTVVTIEDPIIVLGSGSPSLDDNKDRGISFNYYSGSAKTGFFGFDDSAGKFTFIPDATISSEVVSGAAGVIVANLEGNADTATDADGLSSAVTVQLSNQLSGSSTFQDGGDTCNISASLTADAITDQTEIGTVDGNNDHILIYDSGVGLRKVTPQNLINDLNIVTSFNISDGATGVQVDQGETVSFADGTGAEFVVTNVGGQPTVTVNSVDSEIVHDNLNGFVANEHINHSSVVLTAGSGISGGGDITASRTFTIDISEYSAVAVGAGDSFLMLDSDGSTEQRSTVDQLGTYMAGANITNTAGVLSVPDSTIDGVIFESANFVDSSTVDFTVSAGTSVTAAVKDNSITEIKLSRTIETVTSSKTADKDVTLVNANAGNVTITLPENGGTVGSGRVMIVKRVDSTLNNVIVSRETADTIDGATSVQLYHVNETMTFVSDGSNWYII